MVAQPMPVDNSPTPEKMRIVEFAHAILHGDEEHREWLLEAAEAFNAGHALPLARGKGKSEAALLRRVDELEAAVALASSKAEDRHQEGEVGLRRAPSPL